MRKYLPPPHKFRPKTLDSTDTVDFTHFRRTVNRYCGIYHHRNANIPRVSIGVHMGIFVGKTN